jgi:hypothetical protein
MSKKERWGSPYQDNRDWTVYNESLVRRGEFYLSLDFIKQWETHLAEMNYGKRGRPFQYPSLFIDWMACVHIFLQMPYRQMEGFTRKLSKFVPNIRSADYTTLFRRIKLMDLPIKINPEMLTDEVVVAVDSTGIKVTNRGEWMREKWRVRRGWIKVHAMIDVETNQILGIEVTDESVQDDQVFEPLANQAIKNSDVSPIVQILGDGAYDRNHIFNYLEKNDIHSGIKTRTNAARTSHGSAYRAECVRERDALGGYRNWVDEIEYGKRWKVEGLFSSVKRIFGESVRASSKNGMLREARMKFNCYNMLVSMV